jgi:ABC-type Fe3+-hydroxamate transport system substrate-binding protein
MAGFIDQTGRQVTLDSAPARIISVVPSLTELLHGLQLDTEVIAITKFCVHPSQWFLTKPKIGGTKSLDIPRILELNPDLIIANKEENVKEQVEELSKNFRVWVSDINNPEDAFSAIEQIGLLTHKQKESIDLVSKIRSRLSMLHLHTSVATACYLIWSNPYMTIGNDTFIHSMLHAAGFDNVFKDKTRYPTITLTDIAERNPGYILLSSEPFPFKEKHIAGIKEQVPSSEILLVDGEMFSWYGSRMLKAPGYFLNLRQHGIYRK